MTQPSEIFKRHYNSYCDQIRNLDFSSIHLKLGLKIEAGRLHVPFFYSTYKVSSDGIVDEHGRVPDYMTCVVISKYLLLCPDQQQYDHEWVSFNDLKKISHFLDVNYLTSDTVKVIVKNFSRRLDALSRASAKLGGIPIEMNVSYDFSVRFEALPMISLLMLFNDRDDEFPARCSVLFQKQAEHYLDPESLAMISAVLARKLSGEATNTGIPFGSQWLEATGDRSFEHGGSGG